jgi:mRNA interferase MazF/mRNA interferase ChpB
MYIPDQGDIVTIDFDPSLGKEIMKRRPAFVVSRHLFNDHTGFAIVAPITSTVRNMRMEVQLPTGLATQGSVLVHQLRSVDFTARNVELLEKAPQATADAVVQMSKLIIS